MVATIHQLPPAALEPQRPFESIFVGAPSGTAVSHAAMGVKGRLTGSARRDRGRLWFEVDVGEADPLWWTAGNILRTTSRHPMPLLNGAAA